MGNSKKWKLNNPANILLPVFLFVILENFFYLQVAGTVSLSLAFFLFAYSYCNSCRKKDTNINWWSTVPALITLIIAVFILKFVDIGDFNLILPDTIILLFVLILFIFRKFFTNLILHNYGKHAIKIHVNLNLLFSTLGLMALILTIYVVSFLIEKQLDILPYHPYHIFGYQKLILFFLLWGGVTLKVHFLRVPFSIEKYCPILNDAGNAIGYESLEHIYSQKKDGNLHKNIHPVVRILLILDDKPCLKKLDDNLFYPGKWDTSISEHLLYGETFENCTRRILNENYNIKENKTRFLLKYVYENDYERQLVFFSYMYVTDEMLKNADLSNVKPWSITQMLDELNSNIFTEKVIKEIDLIKDLSFSFLFRKKK